MAEIDEGRAWSAANEILKAAMRAGESREGRGDG